MKKTLTTPQLKRYYKKINSIIPKNYPHRQEIISSIHQDISSYLLEYPDISYEDIIEHFGTPEEMTLSFAESLSMEDIISNTRRQRRIHAIFIFMAVGFLAVFIALIAYYHLVIRSSTIGIDESVTIYEEINTNGNNSIPD